MQPEPLHIILEYFYGFNLIRKEGGLIVWKGFQYETLCDSLRKILDSEYLATNSLQTKDTFAVGKRILAYFMTRPWDTGYHHLQAALDIIPFEELQQEQAEAARVAIDVLIALRLLQTDKAPGSRKVKYCGPNVFTDWLEDYKRANRDDRLDNTKEYVVEFTSKNTKKINPDWAMAETVELNTKRWNKFVGTATTQKQQIITERVAQFVATNEMSEEQKRSFELKDVVCRCGFNTVSGGKKVKAGHKKRSRCKKCPGCTAPKCKKCKNCLVPSNKQACVDRVCLFPIIPKCACFEGL